MLLNFEFENFKSFKENTQFTMECIKGNEYKDINTFKVGKKELVKNSIIFGANASGKSNFFKALYTMKNMVIYSMFPIKIGKSIECFRFCSESEKASTKFEIEIMIDNVIYLYGFNIKDGEIEREWLYKNKERKTLLFIRKSSDYKDIEFYSDFKMAERIKENVSKTSLMLSIASMLNIPVAIKITKWFQNLEFLGVESEKQDLDKNLHFLELNPQLKETILSYLNSADFGISDLKFESEEVENKEVSPEEHFNEKIDSSIAEISDSMRISLIRKKVSLKTIHKVYDNNNKEVGMLEFPLLKHESNGTKKLFSMLAVILNILEKGGVIVIDEIDAKLHPHIVRMIIRLFNSLDKNINNAQLICSSHDVLLLEEDIRRDQIWFIDKDEFTRSELYCLSDFGVRKDDNILKKYLLGVFNAIPFKRGDL